MTRIITRDGTAIRATALITSTGKLFVIKAKAILFATGAACTVYPYPWAPYPNRLFYSLLSPVNHGGGLISALNAGAKLHCMEHSCVYNVSKGINHSSGGGGCNWYLKMYNSKGECLEDKYPDMIVTKVGGKIPGVNFLYSPSISNPEVEKDVILSYKDKATFDEIIGTYFTAATEPPKALKFHQLAGGVKNERPSECSAVMVGFGMAGGGVLRENEFSESGIKNLFAAGNVTGNGGSPGFTWGCLVADHVTQLVQDQKLPTIDSEQLKQIDETRKWVFAPLGRKTEYKVNTLELEDYIRQVNYDYIGIHKIKARMERAAELIKLAREGAVPLLTANNPHELMRAIEVQDIIVISELHAHSSLLRDESRLGPVHYREDYPEMDPKWDNKIVTAKKIDGEIKYDIENLN